MNKILLIIVPLFLIIFVTAILRKYKNVGSSWEETLNQFALNIGFPSLIFTSLAVNPISFQKEFNLIFFNSLFLIISFISIILIGKLFKLNKQMFMTLFICVVFGNVAYLGMPVLANISGPKIASTASLIVAVYLFWIFTIGIGYLDYSMNINRKAAFLKTFKSFFKNPLLISVILGLLFGSLKIQIPDIVLKSLNMIA
ncbi:AEC family transporter, partial [Patescibacteria group bacterium]|nr:AEC family transporter [Patescibacteria group bacterium]